MMEVKTGVLIPVTFLLLTQVAKMLDTHVKRVSKQFCSYTYFFSIDVLCFLNKEVNIHNFYYYI